MDGEIFLGIIINRGEDHISLYVSQTGAGVLEKPKDMMKWRFRDITAGQTEGLLPFVPISVTISNMLTLSSKIARDYSMLTLERNVKKWKFKQHFQLQDSGKTHKTNLQRTLVCQGEGLLLQLCDSLLTLQAKASLLLRLGYGNRAGALRGRPATAPRVLLRVEPLPGGHRWLPTRTSLHLEHMDTKFG